MEIEILEYNCSSLVEGEIDHLRKLESLVKNNQIFDLKEFLEDQSKNTKSGIYAGILTDVAGFYELDQSLTRSWILCPKFQQLPRSQVKELLLNRINSVHEELICLPEKLFEVNTIRVVIDGRAIDVKEVCRQRWDYILYQSLYYANEFYVSIVFDQSFVSWSKEFPLSESEAQIAAGGTLEEITAMVHKKRKENRS